MIVPDRRASGSDTLKGPTSDSGAAPPHWHDTRSFPLLHMARNVEVPTMPAFPPGVHLKGGQNAAPVLAEMAREFYAPIIPIVMELHGQGLSLRAIGRELDQRGIRTRIGCWYTSISSKPRIIRWSAAQVRRVLARGLALAETPPEPDPCPVSETAPPASQPTPAAGAHFHLFIDEIEKGPFTGRQVEAMLDAGEITPETQYWWPGMTEWKPLKVIILAPGAKPG
jgi:hypothetical protein